MPIKKLPDDSGATLTVVDLDGYYLPTFYELEEHEEQMRSLPKWKARDDDVMICTYPKSGTHWLWEIVSMLVQKKAERIKTVKETAMLEIMVEEAYDNLPSPRVLNIDYGTWFEYTLKWEKFMADNPDYPIIATTFEDMKEDALREVTRIAKFLEVDCDQAFLQEVTDLCHFDKMKKEKNALEEQVDGWKDGTPGMYRKGDVGDWKNWFTVAQSEYLDTVYREKMKGSKVQPRFTLR